MGSLALVSASGKSSLMQVYVSSAVLLLGSVALVVPTGYSVGAVLLLLGSAALLVKRPALHVTRQDLWVIVALVAYALVGMAEALWDGQGVRGLDNPSRFLFAIPAMLLVMAYPPRLQWMWAGLAVGSVGAGTLAAWQRFVEGASRAGGHTQIIQFGNISLLMGMLCVAGLGWALVQRHREPWMLLLILGAIGGIFGSLLSGSRGGWIGLPLMLLVVYRGYGRGLPFGVKLTALSCVLAAGALVYAAPQLGVQDRVHQAVEDVRLYFVEDNPDTSVGRRLDMWRGAWQLALQSPVVGVGSSGYDAGMVSMVEEGKLHPSVLRFNHAHNEFFDTLAKRGLVGLAVLLMLYLIPMRLFARRLSAPDMEVRSLAVGGTLLSVAYIDFSLTQGFLTHNSGIMVYSFWLAVLWGAFKNANERQDSGSDNRGLSADSAADNTR